MRTALFYLCVVAFVPLFGDPFAEQVRIDRGVKEISLEVESGEGPVEIRAGQTGVVDVKGSDPKVAYKRDGADATLKISAPSAVYVELPRSTIFDIEVDQKGGALTLQLDGLRVREVNLDNGDGETIVRAERALSDLEEVAVEQTAGKLAVALGAAAPELTSVELKADNADVMLDLTGGFVRLAHVEVEGGTGSVAVQMTGAYSKLEKVELESTTGPVTVDLTGVWTSDATLWVETTDGACDVRIPKGVGVIVYASTASGELNIERLKQLPKREMKELYKAYRQMVIGSGPVVAYVNRTYGRDPVTLTLDLNTTTGDIRVHE